MYKHGSYQAHQRYFCTGCDHTFNDKAGTVFAHAKIRLDKLLFAFYSFPVQPSIRQLDAELDVSYRSIHRCVELHQDTRRVSHERTRGTNHQHSRS